MSEHPGALMASLREPTADERTRFAVVADPHVSTREEGTSKLFEHTEEHFRAAIEDMRGRDLDAVVSPGDLTKDGEPWNYDAVDDILETLDVPFYAVPGNHDVPKDGYDHENPSVPWFAEQYGPGELPYRVRVGDVDIIGLNSSGTRDQLYDSHDGLVDEDQREWLADALEDAHNPIVVVHHNFPPVSDQLTRHRDTVESEMAMPPIMREPEAFAETLADGDAHLVFTGHYHLPATGEYEGIREIATPTTCSFPQAYLLCEVTPEGTEIRFVPVADETGLENAHAERIGDSVTSRGLTSIAAARVARFPLLDE